MIILWIRKVKRDKSKNPAREDKQSFQEHNELMKKFRQSHPGIEIITDKDILTGEGNLLAPVQKVRLAANTQN
jgi:hypothetical protein